MDIKQLYRQVIMDHYKNPKNKGLVELPGYLTINLHNPSCGDDVSVQLLLEGDVIKDIRHQGTGCSICCSSASVASETLKYQSLTNATAIIEEFYELIKGAEFNQNILVGDAIVYQTVHQFPARIKCATLAWKAIEEGVEQLKQKED